MLRGCISLLPFVLLAGSPASGVEGRESAPGALPSERVLRSIARPELRSLVADALERNPGVASAEARARAAALEAPQAKALPDPTLGLTAFLETPETRVGPQEWMATLSQAFPWGGKRALEQEAAMLHAAGLEARVEARRLELITEVRRLAYELAFYHRRDEITKDLRDHLLQHEEIARVRYATGVGLGQGVVKLQAEITRVDGQLLENDSRRASLGAQLNGLRDRPAATPMPPLALSEVHEAVVDHDELLERALAFRPELAAAEAEIARAESLIRLAEKGFRPDFKLGLTYTQVGDREDTPGRLQPPEDNGKNIFGIQGGISLPVWRKSLHAGVEENSELLQAAQESRRTVVAGIEASLGDLTERMPLLWQQLRLLEDLLTVQAEEAVASAEAGYIAGTFNALDLLDAEHVLFDARTAVARAQADYLIALARLEGVVGEPLPAKTAME